MRKSFRFVVMAVCFALILSSATDAVNAAPKAARAGQRSVADWYQSEKGEVWPPVAGRYERKNANGITNAYIDVTVLPNQWPVITLHACALVGALPLNETDTDFTDNTLQIVPEAVTGSMMPRYQYIIGNYGFAVKVFRNGTLFRTFVLPKDLNAVYRFDKNGDDIMIYNINGSKG